MNLIDDLGNDLALAFLVEEKYDRKISKREKAALIGRIREALGRVALAEEAKSEATSGGGNAAPAGN